MELNLLDISGDGSPTDWLDAAACVEAELDVNDFFVDAGHVIHSGALSICRRCPVRLECLRHAYARNVSAGYFGGVSPGQRRSMTLEEATAYIVDDTPPGP
jgi:WhiB family transcriptional regulator, redox-sensing transcriptional regulator